MNKAICLMVLAVLAMPACSQDNSSSNKGAAVEAGGKSAVKKVRGLIDASVGPSKVKKVCDGYNEYYQPSDQGPQKLSEVSKDQYLITVTPQADGTFLRVTEMSGSFEPSEWDAVLYGKSHTETRFKQTLQEDGWIVEEGDVVRSYTRFTTGDLSEEKMMEKKYHYTETFRFEGDKRVVKSFISDGKEIDTIDSYIYEVSPTRSMEVSFLSEVTDDWMTTPEGEKTVPFKTLVSNSTCQIDVVE